MICKVNLCGISMYEASDEPGQGVAKEASAA